MQSVVRQRDGFVRSFLSVTVGNYGAIGLSFALNVILTWRLGAEQFGRLALLIMAMQVLTCLISNWTVTALVRFGAKEYARTGTIAESFWSRTLVVAPWAGGAVLALAVWQEQAATYLAVSTGAVWLIFAYFLLSSLLLTFGSAFQASQQMDRYAVTLFADKALVLLGVLLLPVPYDRDPVAVIGCYALSSLVVSLWAMASLGRRLLLPAHAGRAAVADIWKFSLPMIVSTWAGIVGTQWVTYAIIKHYLPLSDLGLYSLANQVAGVVQQVTIISSSLLLPHFSVLVANQQEGEIRALLEKVVPYGMVGFSLMLSLCALLAGPVIPLLFGPTFAGAVPPLILLLVATMALALFSTCMPLVSAYGETWVLTGVTLLSALVNLVAALLLIPAYGINGAALATMLTYATAAALLLGLIHRRLGVATWRLAAMGLQVLVVALCSVWLGGVSYYLAGVLGAAVSVCALSMACGLFERDDLAMLVRADMPLCIKSGLIKVFSEKTS